ncbi:MAG: hypothetical protein ACTSU5_22580 [Promethearchaeota archaeon]
MVDIDSFWDTLDPDVWTWSAILDKDGKILFKSDGCPLTEDEARAVMKAWMNHEGRVEIAGVGYPILKSEPEQLAARNVAGKGAIVGAITSSKDYAIAHLNPQCTTPLGGAAIQFGDLAWKVSGCEDIDEEE